MEDWAGLHVEILVSILEKVRLIEDFASFGCVCKSWWEASRNKLQYLRPQIPWLMLPNRDDHQQIYSICRDDLLMRNLHVPEMSHRKCIGLNYGWVLTTSRTGEMSLVHPLSRSQIQLPNQEFHQFCGLEIAALSANPLESSSDFALMITNCSGSDLRYWRPGDQQWTEIENAGYDYCDMIYFQDHFYVLDYGGRVVIFSVSNPQDRTIMDLKLPHHPGQYIVESNGDLLFVARGIDFYGYQSSEDEEEENSEGEESSEDEEEDIMENSEEEGEIGRVYRKDYHYTIGFLVYKLDLINGGYEQIESLGDYAIFVGHNTSVSLDSLEFPGLFNSNHIYFTDDYRLKSQIDCSGKDMGSYDLEDAEITRFKVETKLLRRYPPFWFIHSFNMFTS